MQFEWDAQKDQKNIQNHGISFNTAILVFADEYRIEKYDWKHSLEEDRYITIGEINGTCMVVTVVYTDRTDSLRIISARKATNKERKEYYDRKDNT